MSGRGVRCVINGSGTSVHGLLSCYTAPDLTTGAARVPLAQNPSSRAQPAASSAPGKAWEQEQTYDKC